MSGKRANNSEQNTCHRSPEIVVISVLPGYYFGLDKTNVYFIRQLRMF